MRPVEYLASLFRWFSFSIIGVFSFVMIVDPYGLHQWHSSPISPEKFSIKFHERIIKPLQFILRDPRIVNFGSSRAAVGIDPVDMQLQSGFKAYNFGITGAHIDETAVSVRHAILSGDVEAIIVGLDYSAFTSINPDGATEAGWVIDGGTLDQLSTVAEISISLNALWDALSTMIKNLRGIQGVYRLDGLFSGYQPTKGPIREYPTEAREPLEQAFKSYKLILQVAKAHDTSVYLYISPVYGREHISQPNYEVWARRIEDIAMSFGLKVLRPDLDEMVTMDKNNFVDSSHFNTAVGSFILKSLFRIDRVDS